MQPNIISVTSWSPSDFTGRSGARPIPDGKVLRLIMNIALKPRGSGGDLGRVVLRAV